MNAIFQCNKVTKTFARFTAVRDVDFCLAPGEVLGYLGPNGAGKSTTIRMLMGLTRPTKGFVRVLGRDPAADPAVRARIGYCPGELRLDDRLTIAETLDTWRRIRGGVEQKYLGDLMQRFEVDPRKSVRSLSTGNRRKVGLIGAFMGRPELLVLDEPTNGLDPLMQRNFADTLAETVADGASVLLSSHVLSEVERLATRLVILRRGQIVADGPIDQFRGQSVQEVEATLGCEAPANTFQQLTGAEDVFIDGCELHLRWRGPVDELVRVLGRCNVQTLRIHEPNLESSFTEFYQDDIAKEIAQ
ncbi:ABC transporter ATP-binding protein [Corynebacterium belfantii]|uniref:ABC transporter ATP-binding protein n=1 Tax=Corynebacterium belfantii TaxID=2014537 RepID=UPI0018D4330F|nr:ABC transporter ATP-binding protein [Corynebacterium belfantii]MBG9311307.1 ABC transporter ATP-binding protein [Corynebacterium belfantii]